MKRQIGLNNVEVLPIDDLMGNVNELILILQFVISLLRDDKLSYVGGIIDLIRLVSAKQKQSHFCFQIMMLQSNSPENDISFQLAWPWQNRVVFALNNRQTSNQISVLPRPNAI